jgi:hypothetical protein
MMDIKFASETLVLNSELTRLLARDISQYTVAVKVLNLI